VFDGLTYPSPTEFYRYSFLVYTYAKQLLAPGQRCGYVALPPTMPDREPMREALMIANLTHGGHGAPSNVLQRAIADMERMSVDIGALQRRRDVMVEGLSSYGYDLHSPEGTFYLLPTSPIADDLAFVDRLAKDKVFVLPGTIVEMPGRFRISVTASDQMVERALPIFEQAAKEA
jgi:aspartate aminotransferase